MLDVKTFVLDLVLLLVLRCAFVSAPIVEIDFVDADFQTQNPLSHHCRLWAMVAASVAEEVVLDHLVNLPCSLKNLGASNDDGWGLAYYNNSEPKVFRSKLAANADPNFNLAAQELAHSGAHVAVGHVRIATSGASDIPDPHPFMRYKHGKWWAFGHNGGLSKITLIDLIGPLYLEQNPPTVGDNWNDTKVVDSELYMLYILKCAEENDWNATLGIAKAVRDIVEHDSGAMNFFLTDGETLWGFCRGNTLYYYINETAPMYCAVASQPPASNESGWVSLSELSLVILTMDDPPVIIADVATIPELSLVVTLPFLVAVALFAVFAYVRKRRDHVEMDSEENR